MILANATIVDENFKLANYDIRIDGERIVEIGTNLSGEEVLDMSGKYILPGLIDIHIHGANGARIGEGDWDLAPITRLEATQGVTGIAITTGTPTFESLLQQLECAAAAAQKQPQGSKILGVHAEGPFLSSKRKGAAQEENIHMPDIKKLESMIAHGKGFLKIITVAPEMPGATELIAYAAANGLVVSMGHTDATMEQALEGIRAGATHSTHTFNAMRPLNHREPSVVGAALLSPEVTCEMICDYVHLHPATIELIYRLKGADRIIMISDSGHAAGVKISEFEVNGIKRYIKDGVVRLEDGTIAGSAKTLLDGVQNLLHAGIPMTDVAKMASYNPAKSLKLDALMGSIAIGKCADLLVLDKDYNVEYTFINGACAYKKE